MKPVSIDDKQPTIADPAVLFNRPISLFLAPRSTGRTVAGEEFVAAMRGAATGVNIVTTDGPAGRFGLTVSAFSSVSAEPPSVLVCINRRSPACAAIRENGRFCVNVLAAAQVDLASTFAGMPAAGSAYDFGAATWHQRSTGAPVLDDAVAGFDCRLGTAIDAASHTIFVGTVHAVFRGDADPLLYANRAYRRACSVE